MVDKESLRNLYRCVEENTNIISMSISVHLDNVEHAVYLKERLQDIRYYMENVYSPELVELKEKARTCYRTWLILKKTHPETASAVYVEYMDVKNKIKKLENPF